MTPQKSNPAVGGPGSEAVSTSLAGGLHDHYATSDPSMQTLSERHANMLCGESGISPEVVARRGYHTIPEGDGARDAIASLGFSGKQARDVVHGDVLVMPIHTPDGIQAGYMIRPDSPRTFENKKKGRLPDGTYPQTVLKYEQPMGASNRLDVPPVCSDSIGNPAVDLWITEGIKKGDALASAGLCAASLPGGVYGFMGRNANDASTVISDFDYIAWRDSEGSGRRVFVVFDSDIMGKPQVKGALKRLTYLLKNKGAWVVPVVLPDGPDGKKVGVDDYLAGGGTVKQLYQLAGASELALAVLASDDAQRKLRSDDYLAALHQLGYTFRMNALNDQVEINGKPISDPIRAKIRMQLRDAGFRHVNIAEDAWIAAALDNSYHPIADYLNNLEWDGKPHMARLTGYFVDRHKDDPRFEKWESNAPVFATYFRRWAIGAVAKALKPGSLNMMLVLDGEQQMGKSHLARWLGSGLGDTYFVEAPIHPDSKDDLIRLASNWLWEVMELASTTRRADVDALKGFITTKHITVRAPYGRYDMHKPAVASFIGTVNSHDGFLVDQTGNRRFLVCTLESINWAYARDIDVNQLWAEAVHLFRSGEQWLLTPAEAKLQDDLNQGYEIDRGVMDWILMHYKITGDDNDFAATSEIASTLQEAGFRSRGTDLLQRDIGAELRKAGLRKGQRRIGETRPTGYYGIKTS